MTKTYVLASSEPARLAFAGGDRRFVTVVTTPVRCGKLATLDAAGAIQFEAAGQVIAGRAKTFWAPSPDSLLALLSSLTHFQYVIPDFVESMILVDEFDLVTQRDHHNTTSPGEPYQNSSGRWLVSLTKVARVWSFGAWRVLDRDVDANTPAQFALPYLQWLDLVDAKLLPEVSKAPRVVWPSSKTRVIKSGDGTEVSLNSHTWIDCSGGGFDRTDEMRDRLRVQAAHADVMWRVPRRSRETGQELPGAGLSKTLFDIAVWTVHRIIYAGSPAVSDGLHLLPAKGQAVVGSALDLDKALPQLSRERVQVYSAKAGVNSSIQFGVTSGRNVIRLVDTDRQNMSLQSIVELDGGKRMTVQDFLISTEYAFDKKYRCQAMFRDSSSMNGVIRKYEHGQVMHHDNGQNLTYWLPAPDWRWVCQRFATGSSANFENDVKVLGATLQALSSGLYEGLREEISRITGLRKAALDSLKKQASKSAGDALISNAVNFLAEDQSQSPPKDIALLRSGDMILSELFRHWLLLLGTKATEAATFLMEEAPMGGSGFVLRFKSFSLAALSKFCKAFPLRVMDPDTREEVLLDVVDVWYVSPKRSGVTRLAFEPGFPKKYAGALNLWTGWPIKPIDDAQRCSTFLQHVKYVIAAGDEEVETYVLNWLAKRVQDIWNRKPGNSLPRLVTAIVLRSVQGTGKGLFEKYIARIFGSHALITARGHGLTGRFNSDFAHLVMLMADEAFFAGDHQSHDVLKSFLTEPVFSFEAKYKDAVSLPNHCAVIMSTNKDWAVPADAGERRMCVLDVSDCRKGDREYFKRLSDEIEGQGPAALFGYLLARDISQFHVEDYPRTQALKEQQERTIARDTPTGDWLTEALEAGEVRFVAGIHPDAREVAIVWDWNKPCLVPRYEVGEAVRKYAAATRKFSPPSNIVIGRSLQAMIGLGHRTKGTLSDLGWTSSMCGFTKSLHERVNVWELPPRKTAQSRFEQYLQTGAWKP